MYLWHLFALDVALRVADRGLGPYSIVPITLVGTIVLAELSYRYFETRSCA